MNEEPDAGRAWALAHGVRLDVQDHFARLSHLFPHSDRGQFGAFNPGTLYTSLKGILAKRAHVLGALAAHAAVLPIFGDAHRSARDQRAQFLVSEYTVPPFHFLSIFQIPRIRQVLFTGPENRGVFLRCSSEGCVGKLPKPTIYGSEVACPLCKRPRPWF